MRRTTETLSSLPTIQNSGYSPERQMLLSLPQGEEGKRTPELILRMSRKEQQAWETEKQISEYCCLLDTIFLTRELASVGHPVKSNMEALTSPQAIN